LLPQNFRRMLFAALMSLSVLLVGVVLTLFNEKTFICSERLIQKNPPNGGFCSMNGMLCRGLNQHTLSLDKGNNFGEALPGFLIAENKGSATTHSAGIPIHDFERGSYHGSQINLIDDQ